MNESPGNSGKSRLALLAAGCAFAALLVAILALAHLARVRGGQIAGLQAQLAQAQAAPARLQEQLGAANAEVARLEALVKQAESESGHPIYSNQ
jgi:hypothetical protein